MNSNNICSVDVGFKKYFCCFMCVLDGLTTVDRLAVFYIDFCCFSNRIVLFLVINDALASSSQGSATIDS